MNPQYKSLGFLPYYLFRCVALGLYLSVGVCFADEFEHRVLPATGEERAVLVLCPGMNGDGAAFLSEQEWLGFARQHKLGVIAISYRSDPDAMYDHRRMGYYWPEQGSGKALLSAIERYYKKPLPVLMYGFSGGAQFTSRFVEWAPGRVVAWAAYSAQFWDSPQKADLNPPGIVACGEYDGIRWFPSFRYFYQGRELGKPWIWISLRETGHVRHRVFEQFVRSFFESVLNGDEGLRNRIYADVGTKEIYSSDVDALQPGLLACLPSGELVKSWVDVHEP